MIGRWCGFLISAIAVGVSPFGFLTAQAAPGEANSQFLDLPAFKMDWTQGKPQGIRVGDRLRLVVAGVKVKNGDFSKFRLELPEGSSPLFDQGWIETGEFFNDPRGLGITVIPVKGGDLSLPPQILIGPDGQKIGRTEAFQISAASGANNNPDEVQKYFPPVGLRIPKWAVFTLLLLSLLAVVALGYAIYRLIKKLVKQKTTPAVVVAPTPEDVEAIQALEALVGQMLWKKARFKPLYFGVSDILKAYVARRFGVDAVEATTHEMMAMLGQNELVRREARPEALEAIFTRLDFVKFTDIAPPETEAEQIASRAMQYVKDTRRPPMVSSVVNHAIPT